MPVYQIAYTECRIATVGSILFAVPENQMLVAESIRNASHLGTHPHPARSMSATSIIKAPTCL